MLDPGMWALSVGVINQRSKKRGKVGGNRFIACVMESQVAALLADLVAIALPGRPGSVNEESGQPDHRKRRPQPPGVAPGGHSKTFLLTQGAQLRHGQTLCQPVRSTLFI